MHWTRPFSGSRSTNQARRLPWRACLSFDFRFLSEEYPARLDNAFNDAFIAELDSSTWNTSAVGPEISAPNNFAALPNGLPVTIKSTAPATLAPSEAIGTPYGAATAPLRAQIFVPVPPVGTPLTHALFLSLIDHGDPTYDSAVFIDNLTLVAPATASACPTGLTGLGPAPAITGPTIAATVDTPTPTLTGTASGPGDVTARIYAGPLAAGAPVQTLPAARSGNAWSAVSGALAPGQYTAQATQSNGQLNGVSAPTTFTVAQPRAAAPQGGSSQQQTPGDRDNDGIPDDVDTSDGSLPPVPGKTFDARVVSGDVFIKYPAGKGPRAVKPLKGFVPLKGAANVPIGSQLDTRKGRIAVTSAADTRGVKTQTSDFYDGIFAVKQAVPKKKPKKAVKLITDLVLKGEPSRSECAPLKGRGHRGRGQEEEARRQVGPRQAVGQRQGQVPHDGQVQLRDGPRDDLVDPGSLRWDVDHRETRRCQRSGLQAQEDGVREGRTQLSGARRPREHEGGAEEVTMATDARIGSELAGYRIETAIGRGGMGVVYRAEQIRLGRKVALKLLAPELAENAGFRARFEHESRLAAALDHPNIVPLYEAGEADGLLFISMRYVEGTDLRALLTRQGRIEPQRAIDIAAQVAGALDAAHGRGLVHRDVKPGNILIAPGAAVGAPEHVYLTDFGLTKDTSSPVELTATGTFVGTIDYIAPEQIEGSAPDGRGDQYALACVLFECLTGHPPFPRDQEIVVMWAHLQDEPPKVTADRPDLPAALDAVIARAMAKAPAERFASCTAMVDAAREALSPSVAPGVNATRAHARPAPATRVGATVPPLAAPPLAGPAAAAPAPAAPAPARPTVAPTRPASGRRAGLALAAVVVVVAAIAGVLAGKGGGKDKPAPAATPSSSGALALSYGAQWKPDSAQPQGLALRDPIALRAGDARIAAGQVAVPGPGLLPADTKPAGETEVVTLGSTAALHHTGLSVAGQATDVFVVPTDRGVQALTCVRTSAADCEAVAATLRLRGASALDVRPSVPYATALAKLLTDRTRRAAGDRRDLARAGNSRSQAAEARSAALAQAAFARRARTLPAPPVARDANAAVVAAIARSGRSYEHLASAATAHDAAAYRRAGRAVRTSEARLAGAVAELELLGYDIQGGA